jgi:hypothetical protein
MNKAEMTSGKKIASFSVPGLAFGICHAIVMACGRKNPASKRIKTHVSVVMAGLRERSCEIMTGTTTGVFLTPDQARFFCAREKAQEKHTENTSPVGGRMSFHYAIPAFTGSNIPTLAKGGAA